MMRSFTYSSYSLRNFLASAVLFGALWLVGCGDNCFSGILSGGFEMNTASAPSACGLTQTKAAVRTAIVQSPSCESCTSSARVEHLFVTLRGVQLHSDAIADQNSPGWVEIAPQLVDEPRQLDLIGSSETEILEDSAVIPAGTYRQVRLEFLSGPSNNDGDFLAKTECGTTLQNCVVMGDGRVDRVLWPGDVPQMVIKGESVQGGRLVVLPDTISWLRMRLEPHQVFTSSANEPWAARVVLMGRATALSQTVDGQRDR
jgi:Domain of unknown function (DUF4382)